jgi:putative spermidine/putrescine transport system permease protein
MALVIATSFTQTSVKWYAEAWNKGEYFESFRLSLLVAALAGLGWFEGLFLAPLILPTIIIGIAILQYFNRLGIGTTFWGLTAGHVVITAP